MPAKRASWAAIVLVSSLGALLLGCETAYDDCESFCEHRRLECIIVYDVWNCEGYCAGEGDFYFGMGCFSLWGDLQECLADGDACSEAECPDEFHALQSCKAEYCDRNPEDCPLPAPQ